MLQKLYPNSSAAPTQTPVAKSNTPKVLPEKYDIVNKFFNSLIISIQLLKMKSCMSTFTKIAPVIKCLTDDRSFTYSHLAQLKFVLPDAIEIRKVLVHNDRTSFMEPDLLVTFNYRAVENDEKLRSDDADDASFKLIELFRSRLLSLFEANPEVDEVPEDKLPYPFSRDSSANLIKETNLVPVHEPPTYAISRKRPVAASEMALPLPLRRWFPSQNAVTLEQEPARVAPETAVFPVSKPHSDLSSTKEGSCVSKWSSTLPESPIKSCDLKGEVDISTKGATPIDGTPSKRVMTPGDDIMKSLSKLVGRSSGGRSITFDTPMKCEMATAERPMKSEMATEERPMNSEMATAEIMRSMIFSLRVSSNQ